MKTPLRLIAFLCIVLISSTAFGAQIALPTVLSNLVGTANFVSVGGLTFDNFDYAFTGDMPPAAGVNVIAITDSLGNAGIRFQGGFVDTTSPGASDALITYRVSAPVITDAHLGGNPDLLGGSGLASITETFLPQVNNDSLSVYDNGTVEQLSDIIFFNPPLQQVLVQKDINLIAEAGSAGASISFVDQTFSVPEPSCFTGLLIGCLTLMLRRRT